MGGNSQHAKAGQKKVKERRDRMRGDPKQKRAKTSEAAPQPTLDGVKKPEFDAKSAFRTDDPSQPGLHRDAFGNHRTCTKCKVNKASYHKPHEIWCSRSKYHGRSMEEKEEVVAESREVKKIKDNARKPSRMTQGGLNNFF